MKTTRKIITSFLLIAAGVLYTSCVSLNPNLNTVRTAHGNIDWHKHTAEEFLTGFDMDGNTKAVNHCPDTWTKTHMHVDSTNTNKYYYDIGIVATGKDNNVSAGIDQDMLFFYAGHGGPASFNTLGNSAALTNMRLGNYSDASPGKLRYYWQCSCEVFAHGPDNCSGSSEVYACPEDFDGSSDSPSMRNVYERWGPILSPDLRMACGVSTNAYCHAAQTNSIWDYYNNHGYEVADAFIAGLYIVNMTTPLCITTGGVQTSLTPLFDQTFTNLPNPSGPYLHIQFIWQFASNVPTLNAHIPELLPVFELIPLPWPEQWNKKDFIDKEEWMFSKTDLKERGIPAIKINKASGSLYVFGERKYDEGKVEFNENEYIKKVENFLKEQGWREKDVLEPSGQKMMLQSAPNGGKRAEEIRNSQKNVVITLNRMIMVNGEAVRTIGQGGKIMVQLNNDGTMYNAAKIWRPIKGVIRTTKARSYEQALEEALQQLIDLEAYRLDDWIWGYDEYAGNIEQKELKAFYIFYFITADKEKLIDYPPVAISISAHLE